MKIIDNTSQLLGDDLKGTLERGARLNIERIKARLANEKQFNKRVEINAELRTARQELEWLTRGDSCVTQTNPTQVTASSASGLVHPRNNMTND